MTGAWRRMEISDIPHVLMMDLRPVDRLEAQAATGLPPVQALIYSLKVSAETYVVTADDKIVAVFGIAPGEAGGVAAPWLLATDGIKDIWLTFARQSRVVVNMWKEKYPVMVNYVSRGNSEAMAWLHWLGFKFDNRKVMLCDPDVEFVAFYYVNKEKLLCVPR